MEKQIWLVEWTHEDTPTDIPSPQFEETITVNTIATDMTWLLFEADCDTVQAMVDRTCGGWYISSAPDGEYIDAGGDTFTIKDSEVVEDAVYEAE
jgi:hypothetical protein